MNQPPAPADSAPGDDALGCVRRQITRWRRGTMEAAGDWVAEEQPIAMTYNGRSFAVMMATPHDLEDFALGFSLSEGLIRTPADLLDLQVRPLLEGTELAMTVAADAHGAHLDADGQRLLPGRSGCGICGTRQLENAVRQPGRVHGDVGLTHAGLERALAGLQQCQPMNAATGAVHAAAWATAKGEIALVREDVGRHNALDKLVGALHRDGIDPASGFALVTSRASYEMVTKAASAGVTVLAAISAPTALAIELARSAGLTLVGFARPGSHNVYTHPERLHAGSGR
ncbi:formate dehydrogenase accessory sulfurtransferase FdhD [Dyella sp. KRB-257]|uniref:formate dehydrogenase accessory sulfurtransferase FdhD n=1 Tax=Dyella sp. KRB-257 TaxID=3400915 RepID=UPI003C05A582